MTTATPATCVGLLPTAYVYPRARRPLRDLLRRRMQLVHGGTFDVHRAFA